MMLFCLFQFLIFFAQSSDASLSSMNFIAETIPENHFIVQAIDHDESKPIIRWLLAGHSPYTQIQNKVRERLFDRAAARGSAHSCVAFLKFFRHFKIKNKLNDGRGTPSIVSLAAFAIPGSEKSQKYEKIIEKILIVYPESIHDKDHAYVGDGRTALHQAALVGNLKLLKMLIERGAAVDAKNATGETPLHFAARFGHVDVLRFLILSGANMNLQTRHTQSTPLMLASESGRDAVIKVLLSLKANKNLKDAFGKTASDRFREHHLKLSSKLMVMNEKNR